MTLERIWSKIFPRTSGRQMAHVSNFYILCRITYKMEIQTNIRKSLFQEMREFSLILFSLGVAWVTWNTNLLSWIQARCER